MDNSWHINKVTSISFLKVKTHKHILTAVKMLQNGSIQWYKASVSRAQIPEKVNKKDLSSSFISN